MKRTLAVLLLVALSGCGALEQPKNGPSELGKIPKASDFAYVGPGSDFQVVPGLMCNLVDARTEESLKNPDKNSPYGTIYSPKGRFLIVVVDAWKTGEIKDPLPQMEAITVVGWNNALEKDPQIIGNVENSVGLKMLDPKLVTTDKQRFILLFLVEGASYGWTINIYGQENGKRVIKVTVDTGI